MVSTQDIKNRYIIYHQIMRMDKPIGTLLLLYPTLSALWIAAQGIPSTPILICFILGTFLMRSAGCVFNDLADRDFDGSVKRTTSRPLAKKTLSIKEALILGSFLAFLALVLSLVILNKLALLLSIPALLLAISYPFTKRFFPLPQAYLGIAFGFGIPMAFAAVQQQVPALAWYLLIANIFWTIAYDTAYAMVDREDDLQLNLKSSAITFGRYDVFAILLCYAAYLLILFMLGLDYHWHWPYFTGLILASIMACYHIYLIRHRNIQACFFVFRHNQYLGLIIFIGIVINFL